jgi:hypothetical protein
MATTAAGKVAATVSPAFIPRYALAAPKTTAISTPRKTALKVNSLRSELAGTNGLNSGILIETPFVILKKGRLVKNNVLKLNFDPTKVK